MQEFSHNLTQIVTDLTQKIQALTAVQAQIQLAIAGGAQTTENSNALEQATASLLAAHEAMLALQKSCCDNQNCTFTWS